MRSQDWLPPGCTVWPRGAQLLQIGQNGLILHVFVSTPPPPGARTPLAPPGYANVEIILFLLYVVGNNFLQLYLQKIWWLY